MYTENKYILIYTSHLTFHLTLHYNWTLVYVYLYIHFRLRESSIIRVSTKLSMAEELEKAI